MLGNRLVIQRMPIDQLKPIEPRLRVHSKKQVEKLQRGLKQFGQVLPIPVTPDLCIIDLELVWQALKNNGESYVDVVIVEVQTKQQAAALRLALNRIAQDSGWNEAQSAHGPARSCQGRL